MRPIWAPARLMMGVELFRDFWRLMIPVFAMVMAVWDMARDNFEQDAILRRARDKLERK
jgi:hypothetical protein